VEPQLVRVLPSAELLEETPGEPRLRKVTVAGSEVLLGRLHGGRVVAMCPHQATQLDAGTFFDGKIRCSLHGYLYDPANGENIIPARDANPANLWKLKPGYLPIYPVEERDGYIWVGPEPQPPPPTYAPATERPPPPGARRAAVPSPPASAATAAGPTDHPTKILKVAPGGTFALRLPTTPRPGFIWRVEIDGPQLSVVEERFEAGDPPVHFIRVAVRGEGEATLRCLYARPWETNPVETRTYQVRVEL
jgi:nitrite reductase/ring-hydroxylating ferredoxin subunit/predicted secreted protein